MKVINWPKEFLRIGAITLGSIAVLNLMTGCFGDRKPFDPSTEITISRTAGCAQTSGRTSYNQVTVNITQERLPNGQVKCIIETVAPISK